MMRIKKTYDHITGIRNIGMIIVGGKLYNYIT